MMKPAIKSKRITYKRVRPNRHIQDLLEELYETAKTKKSKEEDMLKEALNSISKYPLPVQSGDECSVLKGFNSKLCSFINEQLKKHNLPDPPVICLSDNETPSHDDGNSKTRKPQQPAQKKRFSTSRPIQSSTNLNHSSQKYTDFTSLDSNSEITNSSVESTNIKNYKPKYRSGGYAILITLLEHSRSNPNKSSLTKETLIENAQKHSEESFTRSKPDSFYTAWSNMSRLITKGLVMKTKNKKVEYILTDLGKCTAIQLLNDFANKATVNDIIFNDVQNNDNDVVMMDEPVSPVTQDLHKYDSNVACIEMPAGSYHVILLIDKNETGGVSKKNDPTVVQFNKYPDLQHEYRSLKVGDFTWIARNKVNKNQELVLPYIVERKRMDDLGASIKDGRFHEQKFRLRRCGLKNVIYMVENYGSNKHVGLPLQTLMQALANTRVQDGFKVHVTDSLTNSTRFLAMMTKRLSIEYKNKYLRGYSSEPSGQNLMTFEYFNKSSSKSKPLTVTETFIKILLQLKGMSVEKALAITNEFSSPRTLIEAYKKCTKKDGEFLLANIKYGSLNRNVGPNISKSLYRLFST